MLIPESSSKPAAANNDLLPWLIAVAFFMQSLDTTILNTAVPVVSDALGVAPLAMRAVLASYALSLGVFIPISGWMADRFGTRQVFAWAIGLFTLGSVLCGFCSNIHLLVACRVLQGCGGAMMVPVGRLTLVRTFAKSELVRAMSFVAVPALIGPMLGPIAGGLIVAYLNWRFIFFVNLPIGVAGLLLAYLYMPDYRERDTSPLDIAGLILFGSGVALLSYVLEIFGDHTLGAAEILGLSALSLLLIVGYGVYASRAAYPVLQLALFRVRTFSAAVSGSFFTRLGIGGVPFLLPLLYQVGLGLHADSIGSAHHAPSDGRPGDKIFAAANLGPGRISDGADLQHRDRGDLGDVVRHDRTGHAGVAHRIASGRLWGVSVLADDEHEHARVFGRPTRAEQQREFDRQHVAAVVDQFWSCGGGPDHGVFHPGKRPFEPGRVHARRPRGVPRAGGVHGALHDRVPAPEGRRRPSSGRYRRRARCNVARQAAASASTTSSNVINPSGAVMFGL